MTIDNRDDQSAPAGDFSTWLSEVQGAIRGERGAEVPCGGCTACCTSYQFVHIGPEETDTLAHIPTDLLFPAPRLPPGHVLLGYDERGHCPMLVDHQCSIYEHRPTTCRTYDCRVYPAAGVFDDDKPSIATRARQWRFRHPTDADRREHDAVRAACSFIDDHRDDLGSAPPSNATQHAILAIEIHALFLGLDGRSGDPCVVDPDPAAVLRQLQQRRP